MKKTISRILVLTLCLGLLAGCSDKNPTAGTDPEYVPIPELTDPPETTEAPPAFRHRCCGSHPRSRGCNGEGYHAR